MKVTAKSSISEAVRKILAEYPYLEDYLSLGVINQRALARSIFEAVKREVGNVKFTSVVTAVRRYPASKVKAEKGSVLKILAGSEVNLKYDVGVITLRLDKYTPKKLQSELNSKIKSGIHMLIQGIETLSIVAEESRLPMLKQVFKKTIEHKKNLALVVVKSPREIALTHGVIARLAGVLALEKINVVEMMSSYTETCFLIEEKDALKTIEVIRNEIKRARAQ